MTAATSELNRGYTAMEDEDRAVTRKEEGRVMLVALNRRKPLKDEDGDDQRK